MAVPVSAARHLLAILQTNMTDNLVVLPNIVQQIYSWNVLEKLVVDLFQITKYLTYQVNRIFTLPAHQFLV